MIAWEPVRWPPGYLAARCSCWPGGSSPGDPASGGGLPCGPACCFWGPLCSGWCWGTIPRALPRTRIPLNLGRTSPTPWGSSRFTTRTSFWITPRATSMCWCFWRSSGCCWACPWRARAIPCSSNCPPSWRTCSAPGWCCTWPRTSWGSGRRCSWRGRTCSARRCTSTPPSGARRTPSARPLCCARCCCSTGSATCPRRCSLGCPSPASPRCWCSPPYICSSPSSSGGG